MMPQKVSMKQMVRLASYLLIGTGTICLLFFLVNLLWHGWTPRYSLLLIGAACFFAAVLLPPSPRISVALLLMSTLFALYSMEVLLGLVLFTDSRFSLGDWLNFPEDANSKVAVARIKEEKQRNPQFDGRTRLEVVQDLRARGVHAFPDVFPAILFQSNGQGVIRSIFTAGGREFLPLASISRVATVFCNESGQYIVYESDEHGFHNPPGVWEHTPIQVMALGDSYTHGACVRSSDGFVAVIRNEFTATVNLGINGNGPLAMLATLREYGPFLKPQVVLWVYYEGNDSRDLDGREKNSSLLKQYLDPAFAQYLIHRQKEIDDVLADYLEQEMKSHALSIHFEEVLKLRHVRTALHNLMDKRPVRDGISAELIEYLEQMNAPSRMGDLDLFGTILAQSRATVASWGGRMYFVYLPSWERYRIPILANKDREPVLNLTTQLGLPLIDIHPSFAAHPDPLSLFPSRRYAHYNVEGHRVVGQEVLKRLHLDGF